MENTEAHANQIVVVRMREHAIRKQGFVFVGKVGLEQYVLIGVHLDFGELIVPNLVIAIMEHHAII